jgi:hypothetical protein
MHGDQKYGDLDYSFHLDAVEAVAVRFGFKRCTAIRKTCQAHDLIEDRGVTRLLLRSNGFSSIQANAIWSVSDEPGATRMERKHKTLPKTRANRRGTVVKLCDRIANLERQLAEGNRSKHKMYRREHAYFQLMLRHPKESDIRVKRMWLHIDQLLAQGAVQFNLPLLKAA